MNRIRRHGAILWAATALLAPGLAEAGPAFFAGTMKGGQFAPNPAVKGSCYTVRYSTIATSIRGETAETKVTETIIGQAGEPVETVCLIALPKTVDRESLRVTVAVADAPPKALAGRFLEAEQAQAVYEALAKGTGAATVVSMAGKPAMLVESFPLPAKMELCVSFAQRTPVASGVASFRCPMPATTWARGPVARLSLTASIQADRPLRTVFSPSHAATVRREGLRKAQVRVRADDFTGGDDFRLYYVPDEDDLGLRVLAHRPTEAEDGYFLLVGNPTGSVGAGEPLAKDVLFVLDTSGSMRGEKIEQARAAVEYCLQRLAPRDRFNIITFGTEVAGFRDAPVAGDKAAVAGAREFIDAVVARGRTNISGALARGLAGPETKGRLRIMIFLTDGTPTAGEVVPEKIVKQVPRLNTSGTRIFVMGVGHDVNTHLLDKLAEATEGSCEYVEGDQEIDVKIATLYDRLSHPVLNHAAVAFGGLRPTAVFPKKLPPVFVGTEIMVAGRYRTAGKHTVTVSGTRAGKGVTYTCQAELPGRTDAQVNEFVAPLWAARKVGYLLREIRLNGESKELIQEIVRLAKRFGIVTEYTDFLAMGGPAGAGPVSARAATAEALTRLRAGRAQQSGKWAFNQAVNELELQNRTVVNDEANVFRDRRGQTVAVGTVRQVGRQVFYLRDGQWVVAEEAGKRKTRRVKLFSKEYFDLLRSNKDFARAQRLGWNVEMNVGAERIAVEKDGKLKNESLRPPPPGQNQRQQGLRQLQQNNQRVRNQLDEIRQQQIRRRVQEPQKEGR